MSILGIINIIIWLVGACVISFLVFGVGCCLCSDLQSKVVSWKWKKRKKKLSSLRLFCGCGNDLVFSGSFVYDIYDDNGDNHVRYRCTKCRQESEYNFDIAPFPVNWDELNKTKETER